MIITDDGNLNLNQPVAGVFILIVDVSVLSIVLGIQPGDHDNLESAAVFSCRIQDMALSFVVFAFERPTNALY